MWLAKVSWLILPVAVIVIAGCSSLGQRQRIVDIPLAARQADIIFTITTGAQVDISCNDEQECPNTQPSKLRRLFISQVERITIALQKGAHELYPDLALRAPNLVGGNFDVQVVSGNEAGSSSSPSGRIAINEVFAALQPDDHFVAFVIAREMGHVIARHDEENYSASIITSLVLNIALPGSGLIKSAISAIGSRIAAISKRNVQATEADAIARDLLKASSFRLRDVSQSVLIASASLDDGGWSKGFRKSSGYLVAESRHDEAAVVATKNRNHGEAPEKSFALIAAVAR